MDNKRELVALQVYGETKVGWDEKAHPNETVDDHGVLVNGETEFAKPDPRSPPRRAYDDPAVGRLRDYLRNNNGIRNLEICSPNEIERAARIFHRDGFVVVQDLLDSDRLARFRQGCARVLKELLSIPGIGGQKYLPETNRLPHRYSFGTASSSRQLMHDEVWASMIDLPTTTPILCEIFGTDDYLVHGGGGDLCLPGAIEYQHLHVDYIDTQDLDNNRLACAQNRGLLPRDIDAFSELDFRTQRQVMDHTPPVVTINFMMSDLTYENGPIRQIPGTQTATDIPPTPTDEPEWMRLSTLVGVPAGAGIFRDNRAWHGGTPNLSREIRAMPNIEYSPAWRPQQEFHKTMPHTVWGSLTQHAQKLCRLITEEPGVWPAGAGVMHPFAQKRRDAFEQQKK